MKKTPNESRKRNSTTTKKKDPIPPFKIIRTKLSDGCRNNINRLFISKRMKVDASALCDEINRTLETHTTIQNEEQPKARTPSKKTFRELRNLWSALNDLAPKTIKLLSDAYLMAYPMPPPYKLFDKKKLFLRVLNQTEKSHFMRVDTRGMAGLPVTFKELKSRLSRACEKAERAYRPRKGAPRDTLRIMFTADILNIYEAFTKTQAKSTPHGAFDLFLQQIMMDVTNEPTEEGKCYRKLIQAAEASLGGIGASDEEFLRYAEMLTKKFGKEKALKFLESHVLPAQARSLEAISRAKELISDPK